MQIKNLFKKNNVYYNIAVGTDTDEGVINMPMYNSEIVIYKGISNTVLFSIRNNDRKKVSLESNQGIKLVLINQELQIELTKKMTVVDATVGKYKVEFTETDMLKLEPANYIAHVMIYEEEDSSSDEEDVEVLYSSENWNPLFNIEVKPNKMEIYKESIDVDNFSEEVFRGTNGIMMREFISSRISSNVTPSQSFSMLLKNFVGDVYIEGSNEMNPTSAKSDWFQIRKETFTESSIDDSDDELLPFVCSDICACQWVRMRYVIRDDDHTSEVVEAYYRN